MRGVMRVAVVVPAMALLMSGCATKEWVKDLVGKREAEIDQRVGTRVGSVETRLGEESQRVTRVEGQIGETTQRLNGVEAQAGQASETAKAARVRAVSMAVANKIAIRKRHCDRVTLKASWTGPTGEPEPAV